MYANQTKIILLIIKSRLLEYPGYVMKNNERFGLLIIFVLGEITEEKKDCFGRQINVIVRLMEKFE